MKTIIVQGDGIASRALPELDGRTLLQVAKTPHLDELANKGEFGVLTLSPESLSLSSAVTHLALLGYDPNKYYSGLGPFEAASLEVVLEKQDMAYCCQLVTLGSKDGHAENKKLGPQLVIDDEEAGGIDSEDARELIDTVNEQLGSETIQFYTGERHRHLMVWIGSSTRCGCQNPRAARGQSIEPFLPSGQGADVVKELMEASRILLRHHPVNQEREQAGLKPANCLWLWGPGKAIELPKWKDRWSIPSVTISTSGVHHGIAMCAGIDVLNPQEHADDHPIELNRYVQLGLKTLESQDLVYVHVPMPYIDRTTDVQSAVKTIEMIDEECIGPLIQSVSEMGDCRMLVVCNHADEEARGVTEPSPTPYAFLEQTRLRHAVTRTSFDELHAAQGPARDATRVAARVLVS